MEALRQIKRGLDLDLLRLVVDTLVRGESLDNKYRDHDLSGDFVGFRECHVQRDGLLVYRIEQEELELDLTVPLVKGEELRFDGRKQNPSTGHHACHDEFPHYDFPIYNISDKS